MVGRFGAGEAEEIKGSNSFKTIKESVMPPMEDEKAAAKLVRMLRGDDSPVPEVRACRPVSEDPSRVRA